MNPNGSDRLDRIEKIVEVLATRQADLEDDFRRLLTAQVVMADKMAQFSEGLVRLEEGLIRREAVQQHADERMNALIAVVDDIVRGRQKE